MVVPMNRISRDLAAHHSYSRLPRRHLSDQRPIDPEMLRVAIVGAGFAGLRCADVLLRNGIKVVIYEARSRVGGRVHQHSLDGRLFDMGPNWIHGTTGNPIMELAEQTGTVIMDYDESQMVFDGAGLRKSQKLSKELGAETWATIVDAFRYSDDNHADIDPSRSLMDYFREKIAEKYPNHPDKAQDLVNEARMWGPFIGDPMDRQSLRNFFLEECLEGENVFVASTYHDIATEVARNARDQAEIRLNQEVARVEYRQDGDTDSKVALTTVGGERQEFDEVVVTSPLGWLKRHSKNFFSPALPHRLQQAIDNINYGNLEKIYVTFPSAWWTNDHSDGIDSTASNSSVSGSEDGDWTPPFYHFHHPSYHPDPASRTTEFWNQSVVSLAHAPKSSARPTLLFYLYGPCSIHVTSLIKPHAQGSDTYNSLVHKFTEPFFSRIPSYSKTNPACIPTSYLATQWSNDEYAGYGSYSNYQVGLVQGDKDIECLRAADGLSAAGRGLWIAGEHTAPFVALGTTTGAYWSGEAVAKRMLDRYGIGDTEAADGELKVPAGEVNRKQLDSEKRDAANLSALAI